MKELSVFVDESGDFGAYNPKSPFYIISIVAHDQANDISAQVKTLDDSLKTTPLNRDFIHIGPLIRRENEYLRMNSSERLQILRRIIKFATKTEFLYKTIYIEKKHISNDKEMIVKLAKQLSAFLKQHYPYFLSFNKIKLYYDHGQDGVFDIIISVFTTLFENVDYKKSQQKDYKMLQVADLICTTELVRLKMNYKILSQSEKYLLGNNKSIEKLLLKPLRNKEFRGN